VHREGISPTDALEVQDASLHPVSYFHLQTTLSNQTKGLISLPSRLRPSSSTRTTSPLHVKSRPAARHSAKRWRLTPSFLISRTVLTETDSIGSVVSSRMNKTCVSVADVLLFS
jgi:hypothetical protein